MIDTITGGHPGHRKGWSASDAAEIARLTYRQLDYWSRTDLVRASIEDGGGSGSRRRYSYLDLVRLAVVRSLLDAGVRLDSVRELGVVDLPLETGDGAALIIHGRTAMVSIGEHELSAALADATGVIQLLSIGRVRSEIDNRIIELGR